MNSGRGQARCFFRHTTICCWCVVYTTLFILSIFILGSVYRSYYDKIVAERKSPFCYKCETEKCQTFGLEQKEKGTELIFYTQLTPPKSCEMKTHIYRYEHPMILVLVIGENGACEEDGLNWNVYYDKGENATLIPQIYTNLYSHQFLFFYRNGNMRTDTRPQIITDRNLTFGTSWDSSVTQQMVTKMERRSHLDWFAYFFCYDCVDVEIIAANEICSDLAKKLDTLLTVVSIIFFSELLCLLITIFCCIYSSIQMGTNIRRYQYTRYRDPYYLAPLWQGNAPYYGSVNDPNASQSSIKQNTNNFTKSGGTIIEIPPEEQQQALLGEQQENEESKEEKEGEIPHEMLCVACMERPKSTVLLDCNHVCLCVQCCRTLLLQENVQAKKCPLCRTDIEKGARKIFM